MEDVTPAQNSSLLLPPCPPVAEDVTILSGEYCEIDMGPGIPERDENESYPEPSSRRSPLGLSSTQGLLCTKLPYLEAPRCWDIACSVTAFHCI